MKYCCVPGCYSKSSNKCPKVFFYRIPSASSPGGVTPFRIRRRVEWVRAIQGTELPETRLKNCLVCSKHFHSGRPAQSHNIHSPDWIPTLNLPRVVLDERKNASVRNIIMNLPEIHEKFDVPEYVIVDETFFNEKSIELNLIQKYITNPICDENGYYNNDHDYLGLPLLRPKTDAPFKDRNEDHNYALTENPACLYFDSTHFCNLCRRDCSNLFTFNSHMMAVHTVRNDVTCEICKQSFLTSTCLNNHLCTHTVLCDKCGNEIPTVQLKAHQVANRRQKRRYEGVYQVVEEDKVHFCVFCMKGFESKTGFALHVLKHTRRTTVGEVKIKRRAV